MPQSGWNTFTIYDRHIIERCCAAGRTHADIAGVLGKNQSSVTREINRGLTKQNHDWYFVYVYTADMGQSWRDSTDVTRNHGMMFEVDPLYKGYVKYIGKLLRRKFTLAGARNLARKSGKFRVSLSLTTLCKYRDRGVFEVYGLPSQKKRKKTVPRPKKPSVGTSIEQRPKEIDKRETFGHWEMDTVKGKQGVTKGCLLVLTERKTRFELIEYMKDQGAASVVKALNSFERKLGTGCFRKVFKTITVDNGVEFSDFEGMETCRRGRRQRTVVYYCHAYRSNERGSNENQNRFIRRFAPKKTDLDKLTSPEITHIERFMNHYPRPIFDSGTSYERFTAELEDIGVPYFR